MERGESNRLLYRADSRVEFINDQMDILKDVRTSIIEQARTLAERKEGARKIRDSSHDDHEWLEELQNANDEAVEMLSQQADEVVAVGHQIQNVVDELMNDGVNLEVAARNAEAELSRQQEDQQ